MISSAHSPVPVLAFDIGGTKINAAVVEGDKIGFLASAPTPAKEGAQAVVAAAISAGREALEAWQAASPAAGNISAVGIASAGVIDPHRGVVTNATDALPGWPGTNLVGDFSAAFGVPARALNDVHAHGLGEARFGVGNQHKSLLLVAVGTGVGGAFVELGDTPADSRVQFGVNFAAGHVGHVPIAGVPDAYDVVCSCGRLGHVEGFASGPGIAAALTRRGVAAANTREVAELANGGDAAKAEAAQLVLADAGRATGRAIGGLLNVLNPSVVALTGGVTSATGKAFDTWHSALLEGVAYDAMDATKDTPIEIGAAGNHAALLGAAAFALTKPA